MGENAILSTFATFVLIHSTESGGDVDDPLLHNAFLDEFKHFLLIVPLVSLFIFAFVSLMHFVEGIGGNLSLFFLNLLNSM